MMPRIFAFSFHLAEILCFMLLWRKENTALYFPFFLLCSLDRLELYMKQQTGSKLGKEYIKAVYCHPVYMQNTSCKMLGWMKHKLDSRLLGEISITSDMQIVSHIWQKAKRKLKRAS